MFCLPVCDAAMSKFEHIFIWRGCAAALGVLPLRELSEAEKALALDSFKSCQATEEVPQCQTKDPVRAK